MTEALEESHSPIFHAQNALRYERQALIRDMNRNISAALSSS